MVLSTLSNGLINFCALFSWKCRRRPKSTPIYSLKRKGAQILSLFPFVQNNLQSAPHPAKKSFAIKSWLYHSHTAQTVRIFHKTSVVFGKWANRYARLTTVEQRIWPAHVWPCKFWTSRGRKLISRWFFTKNGTLMSNWRGTNWEMELLSKAAFSEAIFTLSH